MSSGLLCYEVVLIKAYPGSPPVGYRGSYNHHLGLVDDTWPIEDCHFGEYWCSYSRGVEYEGREVKVGDELYFADLDNNKIVASRYNGSGVSWFEAVTAKGLVNMSKAYFSREDCRFNEIKVFSHLEMEQILKSK